MSIQIIKPCPCGGESLDICCGRFISGKDVPETPEQLMRSRYSAYVLGDEAYLRATWDSATCPPEPLVEPNISWVGLEVRSSQHEGDEGIVEFVARAKVGGRARRLHETSRFVRREGRWLYVDGDFKA
jgi:SEC-C motif-containing protein